MPVTVEAPSNIALLKYWGKDDATRQWPSNDSISLTLSRCRSITTVRAGDDVDEVYLQGGYLDKETRHGRNIYAQINFLRRVVRCKTMLRVETMNTFPLARGIASSASGMAALTVACIACWLEAKDFAELQGSGYGLAELTKLARFGSGSACRSLLGGVVKWERGGSPATQRVYQLVDENYWQLCDIIVVPDVSASKEVSSRLGHERAKTSPVFALRIAGLTERENLLQKALRDKDIEKLGLVLEQDALEFMQVMATSTPPLAYPGREAVEFLVWLRRCRCRGDFVAYFTIDAGSSVHVLCPVAETPKVEHKIRTTYPHYEVIVDKVGSGPKFRQEHG